MKTTSKISLLLFLVILAVVIGSTTIEVITRHNAKLLKVAEKTIVEAASKCYIEEKCTGDTTSLDELIKKDYLEPQVHPISKEYIDTNLVIVCRNYKCETTLK